jgi:tetratricopeptide (TPR) repeat protein
MKRLIIVFIAILVMVFMVFTLLDRASDYTAEKLFYRAIKTFKTIAANPDVAPPRMVKTVEGELQIIIHQYPESPMAKSASMKLVELYYNDKQYDKALAALDQIIEKYPEDVQLVTRSLFTKASIYERQDRWDEALNVLKRLKEEYIDTPIGLQVPLYIATYYRTKGTKEEATRTFDEAVLFYNEMKGKNAGTTMGYASAAILVQVYLNFEKFDTAGKLVDEIITTYPTTTTLMQQLPYVDLIFVKILKRPENAISIYRKVIEQTSNEKVKEVLEKAIQALEQQQ